MSCLMRTTNFFHLFARGIVRDLHEEALATLGPEAEVLDRRVHDRAARDRHQRIVRRSDAGAAEADVLDRPFAPADPDDVADAKRLLHVISNEPMRLAIVLCAASATARPPTPRPGEN